MEGKKGAIMVIQAKARSQDAPENYSWLTRTLPAHATVRLDSL